MQGNSIENSFSRAAEVVVSLRAAPSSYLLIIQHLWSLGRIQSLHSLKYKSCLDNHQRHLGHQLLRVSETLDDDFIFWSAIITSQP